ncbi:hypothetical protein JKP88DRAFT_349444 [Tribonema minus]|uniref:Uncharacterized protein n=1 Tax=Tribonema minus TaxID=303371 RepID=A0A835YSC1_9STRA|nr:hypothetical protein JKP88DRAFT_349444 [Tribonema minus]
MLRSHSAIPQARAAHFISTVRGPIYFKQRAGHQQGQAWDCSLLVVKHLEAMLSADVGQNSSSAQAQAMLSADARQKKSSAQGPMLSADAGRRDSSSAQGDDVLEAAAAAAAAAPAAAAAAAIQGHLDAMPHSTAAASQAPSIAIASADPGGNSAHARDARQAAAEAASNGHSATMARLSLEEFVATQRYIPTLSEMTVLELGCAVGLPGVAAAVLGARSAVLTDLPDGAAAARETLLLNKEALGTDNEGANPNARAQGWPPDLVLMSDLLYGDVTAAAALVGTLRQVCGPETQVISCHERRFAGDGGAHFFSLASEAGFVKTPLPFPPSLDIGGSEADIELCRLTLTSVPQL